MPLTESNELAGYYPSDERAVARLRGTHLPVTHAQQAIDRLTGQLHRNARINAILQAQLEASQAEATKWRNRCDFLSAELRRERARKATEDKIIASRMATPEPRAPRSYAERMRAKRF